MLSALVTHVAWPFVKAWQWLWKDNELDELQDTSISVAMKILGL